MKEYIPSKFYNADHLDLRQLSELVKDIRPIARKIFLDEMSGIRRERTAATLDYILTQFYLDKNRMIKVAHEYEFVDAEKFQVVLICRDYKDREKEYFAWFEMAPVHEEYVVKKYSLELLK